MEISDFVNSVTLYYFKRGLFTVGRAYKIVKRKQVLNGLLLSIGLSDDDAYPRTLTFAVVVDHKGTQKVSRCYKVSIDDILADEDDENHVDLYELYEGDLIR
jgi:hypothetical protein